jgi:hypothetical protein
MTKVGMTQIKEQNMSKYAYLTESRIYLVGKNTDIIRSTALIKVIMPAPGVIMTKQITCKVVKHIHLVYRGMSKLV